jgi:hypothetical protein
MGNREMKDPTIFKDSRESKVFHNYSHQELKTNSMVPSNNTMPLNTKGEVEEMAEATEG